MNEVKESADKPQGIEAVLARLKPEIRAKVHLASEVQDVEPGYLNCYDIIRLWNLPWLDGPMDSAKDGIRRLGLPLEEVSHGRWVVRHSDSGQ